MCDKEVPPRKGDFQHIKSLPNKEKVKHTGANYHGKWLVRCFACKGLGNKPLKQEQLCRVLR